MVPPPPRTGTFSPSPAQALQTGISHSPHPSQTGGLSAGASPNTSSPTGTTVVKISIAQVFLLLSTIKDDKDDPTKWEASTEQLRKLIDDNGMEVYSKYITRLVAGNAGQIFPGSSRTAGNLNNGHLLKTEMKKVATVPEVAREIAASIESGTEEIFRDFDLSTFMEYSNLDPLEKTVLALAFKIGSRPDLRAKADAILSTNYPTFLNILSRPDADHKNLSPAFLALIVDRYVQEPPPSFNANQRQELAVRLQSRYAQLDQATPTELLAALDLWRVLATDHPANALSLYIKSKGADFTRDPEACVSYLQSRPSGLQLTEEQVAAALTYTTISQTPVHNPSVLVSALRQVLNNSFKWQLVVSLFDQPEARISSSQFLRLYNALVPIAKESQAFDIQQLWGGDWENAEAQLSYICAFASLKPEQLDATTIPGLQPTFTVDLYAHSDLPIRERAKAAVRHPLVSVAALSAIFHVALHSLHASQTQEAKRLFQEVVVPNLDIFLVSAFGVPKPWPPMAVETADSLFENFLYKRSTHYEFVLDSLWSKDTDWVKQRLADAHAAKPVDLPLIFDHAVNRGWLNDLVYMINGLGLDLAALAHAEGKLDLNEWSGKITDRNIDITRPLMQFLSIKIDMEKQLQRPDQSGVVVMTAHSLHVKTVSAFLDILGELLPKNPVQQLIHLQRQCIVWYPRLINYGEGYDDVIDASLQDGNALPPAATARMEEHYKKMYSQEVEVRDIVQDLERYKDSRNPLDQDIFACMIHGLFDEYTHFVDYPLEALATTAVLFGGIISHKLISGIPLQIGLGMILEAIRDHSPEHPMYKFGLQALLQLFGRLREWPGFCGQLLIIPGLQGTEAFRKAEDVVRSHEEAAARTRNGEATMPYEGGLTNGNADDGSDSHACPPFSAINIDTHQPGFLLEDPDEETQGKIQFVLNNITEKTLQSMFKELAAMVDPKYQQWFATHLVEDRAKMQPNYHHVYLELVKQFGDRALWAEVLRETYISVARMLNAEVTLQNSSERGYLKNLGVWLGMLTLARDKPIKHKNIAVKELLLEALDTKRLIVVIPFVCKVLAQGALSNVFRPPNPWLMDILHLLIELYHNAELKLNLKFEIEVLCQGLSLDHKSIEPSGEIVNRAQQAAVAAVVEEPPAEHAVLDTLEPFDSLSLNGLGGTTVGGLSPHAIPAAIPDISHLLAIPPTSEMVVSSARLTDIVRTAIDKALHDIIQPVVDRSVTIAAISTQQMIHKDFSTEPDENRVKTSAINMVKATAGSLALVTSREPLRANIANHMRALSNDLPQALPEGTIHMCVNLNLDTASKVIEKAAEERAVPEIVEMIQPELEARRQHRASRPNEPYVDQSVSRWSWTIPNPYKLSPNLSGLNPEQMAIYEDFARQPRSTATPAAPTHGPSTSDASRSLANEVLQDQYSSVPALPTPAETPSIAGMGSQQLPPYAASVAAQSQAGNNSLVNGRQQGLSAIDSRVFADRVQKLLIEIPRVAAEAGEEHFDALPRQHALMDIVDALIQVLIKAQQNDLTLFAADLIMGALFENQTSDSLAIETFIHVLLTLRKIAGPALNHRLITHFHQQSGSSLVSLPLIKTLLRDSPDLLNWKNIDAAIAEQLKHRKEHSISFLERILDLTVLSMNPVILYVDLVHSLEEAWAWIAEDADLADGQRLKSKVLAAPRELPAGTSADDAALVRQDQMEYVFDEWANLSRDPRLAQAGPNSWPIESIFIQQMHAHQIIATGDDLVFFTRWALERAVDSFENSSHSGASVSESYVGIDALGKLIGLLVRDQTGAQAGDDGSVKLPRPIFLDSILSVALLVLNHHLTTRGEQFNQRPFFRFFAVLLHEVNELDGLSDDERQHLWLVFATRIDQMGPALLPGFAYGWIDLLSHRLFLPTLLKLPGNAGWRPFTRLLLQLLEFAGELYKPINLAHTAKDMYRATTKVLAVLQHDFPEYLAANYIELNRAIPPHCTQLRSIVLAAAPVRMPDPLHPGLQVERMDESRVPPVSAAEDPAVLLGRLGLLSVLDQTMQDGPSEDAIAHITRAIIAPSSQATIRKVATGYGHVPLSVDLSVIDAVVTYIGAHAAARIQQGGQSLVQGAPDMATLNMLMHELSPEGRYFLISAIVNQLRFANTHTTFFCRVLLEIFGTDTTDPEELEIKQQICRVLLERLIGFYSQPWGLIVAISELLKNDKYSFFDLPFIKSAPEVAERFVNLVNVPTRAEF